MYTYSNITEDFGLPMRKRGVDFMGMRVSYPQYYRLMAIQKEVIRMDQTIRAMARHHDPQVSCLCSILVLFLSCSCPIGGARLPLTPSFC